MEADGSRWFASKFGGSAEVSRVTIGRFVGDIAARMQARLRLPGAALRLT
jgi:hypothetical protein